MRGYVDHFPPMCHTTWLASSLDATKPQTIAVQQHHTSHTLNYVRRTGPHGTQWAHLCKGRERFFRAHLVDTLLVVRLCGALSAAERQLLQPNGIHQRAPAESNGYHHNGDSHGNVRSLLKQVRGHMVAIARTRLAMIVQEATGVPLVSVHHDISTVTGEEVLVFSLGGNPDCRPKRLSRTRSD
ncbi:MAG: Na-translocating system protein MpsC family protein [Pirellulales bacterium]